MGGHLERNRGQCLVCSLIHGLMLVALIKDTKHSVFTLISFTIIGVLLRILFFIFIRLVGMWLDCCRFRIGEGVIRGWIREIVTSFLRSSFSTLSSVLEKVVVWLLAKTE